MSSEKIKPQVTLTMKSLLVTRTRIKNIAEIKSSQFNWIDFHLPYITRNNPKVVLLLLTVVIPFGTPEKKIKKNKQSTMSVLSSIRSRIVRLVMGSFLGRLFVGAKPMVYMCVQSR